MKKFTREQARNFDILFFVVGVFFLLWVTGWCFKITGDYDFSSLVFCLPVVFFYSGFRLERYIRNDNPLDSDEIRESLKKFEQTGEIDEQSEVLRGLAEKLAKAFKMV